MMRMRRDPFARMEYHPTKSTRLTCDWCGQQRGKGRPIYDIRQESDGGRSSFITGGFCSWSCAESYHGQEIGR